MALEISGSRRADYQRKHRFVNILR